MTTAFDWKPLSQLFAELNHSFALLNCEGAIVEALRSGEVPVRARAFLSSEFRRLEKRLSHQSRIEVHTNRIELHSDKVKTVVGAIMTARGMGDTCFRDVEADGERVKKWLLENAMPRGYVPLASGDESVPKRRGGRVPAWDWDVVRNELFRLMHEHGDFMVSVPEWNAQARLERKLRCRSFY